jgi:hypothetical protein
MEELQYLIANIHDRFCNSLHHPTNVPDASAARPAADMALAFFFDDALVITTSSSSSSSSSSASAAAAALEACLDDEAEAPCLARSAALATSLPAGMRAPANVNRNSANEQ